MALSLASAALGIGLIAFINQRLIETVDTTLMVLPEFLGLLLLLMVVTLGSQLALTTLGVNGVCLYDGSWSEWGARTDLPIEPAP